MKYLRNIYSDFTDDRALKGKEKNPADIRLLGVPIAVFISLLTLLKEIKVILISSLGLNSMFIPIILIVVGIAWSYSIISQKVAYDSKFIGDQRLQYKYHNQFRQTAKVIIVTLSVILTFSILNVTKELTPLPTRIFGYIQDARTGRPIENATILIENEKGIIGSNQFFTDSEGFYIIELKDKIYRDYRFKVYMSDCSQPTYITLNSWNENNEKQTNNLLSNNEIVFKHLITCP